MNQDTDHIIQNPNNISYKMYTCNFCNYKSERIWCINRHIKAHHKHPMFKCKHCDYQSNRRYNLKQHEKIIHGYQEPTNNCAHCDCKNANGKHMKNEDARKDGMTEEEVKNMISESFEGFPEYMMMKLHTTEVKDEERIEESINGLKYYMLNKIKK